MRRSRLPLSIIGLVGIVLSTAWLWAAPPVKRARPPKWDKSVTEAFFPDAREALSGPRPEPAKSTDRPAEAAAENAADRPPTPAGTFAWSKLIEAETIEDEIKACQAALSEGITVPAQFKSEGHKVGRMQFTMAATMFGIAAQFDGDVRWQRQAAAASDALAKAGFNCKAATDATYNESRSRKDDLENLVRGSTPPLPTPSEEEPTWNKVASRNVLMLRMEHALKQGISTSTSNSGEFAKNASKLQHEAQILAALAEIIQREKFEDADDETYQGYASAVRDNAVLVNEAVKSKQYEQARKAAGAISKACTSCHEAFRAQ